MKGLNLGSTSEPVSSAPAPKQKKDKKDKKDKKSSKDSTSKAALDSATKPAEKVQEKGHVPAERAGSDEEMAQAVVSALVSTSFVDTETYDK